MSAYDLPTSAVINGTEYDIRSDYRAILDIISVMCDSSANDKERAYVTLSIFYPDFESIPSSDYQEALDFCLLFINGGVDEKPGPPKPKVMDWKQDFPLIVSPINKALGFEIRSVDYLHWWTFLAAYQEIGDCLFAHVVSIRRKKKRGQKLDKSDQQFYRENRQLIDLRVEMTTEEKDILDEWMS